MSDSTPSKATVYRVVFPSIVQEDEFKRLERDLTDLVERRPGLRLAIDLSRTFRMSSRALGLFVALRKRLRETQGYMVFFGTNPAVLKVMQVTRIHTLIPILDTEEKALEKLRCAGRPEQ